MADDGDDKNDLIGIGFSQALVKSNYEFVLGPVCRTTFADLNQLIETYPEQNRRISSSVLNAEWKPKTP